MTTMQMNAEILRNMSIIAEDERLMARAAKYLRKLVSEKEDAAIFTKEEFYGKLEQAERSIAEGKGHTFTHPDDMNAWLNAM